MVEQLKKSNIRKSKSFSFKSIEGSWNENSNKSNSGEKGSFGLHADDTCMNPNHAALRVRRKGSNYTMNERSSYESGSPTSTRSPLKILRPVSSYGQEDGTSKDPIAVRVPLKRRKSFMPITSHSNSILHSSENISGSSGSCALACPVFELDDENDDSVAAAQQLPTRRRNSFMPSSLRGVSLSPKPVFKKQAIIQRKGMPPLLRTLSYNASTDTCNSETDHSDHTRSTTGTPTSSSSDLQQQDEQGVLSVLDNMSSACVSVMETNNIVNVFDIDKSTRSTVTAPLTGVCVNEKYETKMSSQRSMSNVIGMFLWHYLKVIGLTLNLKTIIVRVWMTLFDIVIEAVSITVELMSYVIPITLRIFETSMLWFVQQVHIRRLFIFLYDTFKHRKNGDVDANIIDETTMNATISSPIEKSNRRPIRFLSISRDNGRKRSIRVGSYKD